MVKHIYQVLKPTVTKGLITFMSIALMLALQQRAKAATVSISMKPFQAIEHALRLQDNLETKISLLQPSYNNSLNSRNSNKSTANDVLTQTNISISSDASSTGSKSEPMIEINGQNIVPGDSQGSATVTLPVDTDIRVRYRQSDDSEGNSNFNLRINGSDIAN